jgi:hypothetical protein
MRYTLNASIYIYVLLRQWPLRPAQGWMERKHQSFVAKYEGGERRLAVVEFLVAAGAVGADPVKLLQGLKACETTNISIRCRCVAGVPNRGLQYFHIERSPTTLASRPGRPLGCQMY